MGKEVKKIREIKSNVKIIHELDIKENERETISKNESAEFQEDFSPTGVVGPTLPLTSSRARNFEPESETNYLRPRAGVDGREEREEREQGNRVDYMAIGNRAATSGGATGEPRAYKPIEGIQSDRIRSASVGREFAIQTGNNLLSEQDSTSQIERRMRDEEDLAREKYHVDAGQPRKGKRYAWEV